MVWAVAALGLLLLALVLPHAFRLYLAANFRAKPSVYTPMDQVPPNLGEFREYAQRVLRDAGFTTLDYEIEDAMTSEFAVVGLSADGLLCAFAKQAGGIKLQLSVAALLNDGTAMLAALPRFMLLFQSEHLRLSVSTASDFNEVVSALRLDIQALRQRGIDNVASTPSFRAPWPSFWIA